MSVLNRETSQPGKSFDLMNNRNASDATDQFKARCQADSTMVTETVNPHLEIPDARFKGISSEIEILKEGKVRNTVVAVNVEHTYIGDLRVELISPSGKVVRLHNSKGGPGHDIKRLYDATSTPDLSMFLGDSIRGNWQLRVRDLVFQDTGMLICWSITLEY